MSGRTTQPLNDRAALALERARQAQHQLDVIARQRDVAMYEAAELGASRRQIAAAVGISLGAAHNHVVAGGEPTNAPKRR